jgi:AcrR family transcriptional regulator/DNA-binding MarR family transcriptional regulator
MPVAGRPGVARAVVPVRRGGGRVSEVQRSRVLRSAVRVVSEYGYAQMTVARVAGGARVSRRTFYELFDDREGCFLAAFDDGVARVSERVLAAFGVERGWRAQVRGGLAALLEFLDEQPRMGSLLIVDALQAGPRVQERRAMVLRDLAEVLQRDGSRAGSGRGVPPLTGEGVVGALLGVIHTRLSGGRHGSMLELLNPLVGMVVLSYLGAVAAQGELECPVARSERARGVSGGEVSSSSFLEGDLLADLPMRLTGRTLLVLQAIGERPGASNREVGELGEVQDQGQISKLLRRLEGLGLVENVTRQKRSRRPTGAPNAWRLTARGGEIWQGMTDQVRGRESTDRGDVPSDHDKGMVR